MIGAHIHMDRRGRITRIYLIADSETECGVVEWGLARITRPATWGWLSRLFRKGR